MSQSFDKWGTNPQEVKGVTQGIRLSDYGKEQRFRAEVKQGVEVLATDVMVSGEHIDGKQKQPVERIYHDTASGGADPLATENWDYALLPDDKVELQHIRTTSRDGDNELVQDLNRIFRKDGSIDSEEVHVDGKLFKRRTHAPKDDYEGDMVYDDYYDKDGKVERRVVFFKKQGAGDWASYKSVYQDGQDRLERTEGSLAGPPALEGVPQLNRLTETPKMEYRGGDDEAGMVFEEAA